MTEIIIQWKKSFISFDCCVIPHFSADSSETKADFSIPNGPFRGAESVIRIPARERP